MSKFKNKTYTSPFNTKRKKIAFGVILIGAVIGGFVLAITSLSIPALRGFKNINYTNSKGTSYTLDFYAAHTTKQLETGNTQLVSKVSRDDKFPLGLSIISGDLDTKDTNKLKDCTGPLPKAMEVQNNNVQQKIYVCYLPQDGGLTGLYVARFDYGNKTHIITIAQDVDGLNVSNSAGAQKSLTKVGTEPYKQDIERIVSSIAVQ